MEDEEIPYDDPRFVEILEACLCVEIGTYAESYDKAETEIKKIKRNVLTKIEKRKELKIKIKDAEDVTSTLKATFQRLREESIETKQRITFIGANIDHRSKLILLEIKQYKDILQEYQTTWQSYFDEYEKIPLAKKRNEERVRLKKVTIEKMILEFKIKDLEKTIVTEKKIDEIKMRLKVIELVKAKTNKENLRRKLVQLKKDIECSRNQLQSTELELKTLEKQLEEAKKERAMKILEMPPPKINLSRLRLNCMRNWKNCEFKKQPSRIDADSISVNTIALEEMCIRDETLDGTPKRNDSENDEKRSTSNITTEKSSTAVATPLQKIHDLNASRSVQPSMYGDNSRNFQISDCGNASNVGDFDVNMDSIDADCDQINCEKKEKEASPQVTSRFNFSDLLKLKADNDFRIF
ncbi:uncharacterized protein LOC122523657 [Polistes fuscatus]|uniref:uncharacterized protein LOC122523657 n=1 Tax=Polistes fuscatus TaxID=30207 RepID=UPI001CA9313F|nr:uncharacterized protein LOC122523657 [Polistes fuscatus]